MLKMRHSYLAAFLVFLVASCSQSEKSTEDLLSDDTRRQEIMQAILQDHDRMLEMLNLMIRDEHAMLSMRGNHELLSRMMETDPNTMAHLIEHVIGKVSTDSTMTAIFSQMVVGNETLLNAISKEQQ